MSAPPELSLGSLTPEAFLEDYWQKRPLLVRGAGPAPQEFDRDRMCQAVCHEDSDSRLITGNGDTAPWQLTDGPLEPADIPNDTDGPFTLLLRNAELVEPALSRLQDAFSFISKWRHQDVMVSYANKGGGVGPHTDQYDVFLFQGPGKRQWSIGEPGNHAQSDHDGLSLINKFPEISSYLVEPGDLLYLPPGTPHWGTATEPCFTYSIGFRTPSASELLWALANILEEEPDAERYADVDLETSESGSMLSSKAAQRAAGLINAVTADESLMRKALALWASEMIGEESERADTPASANWRKLPEKRLVLADERTLFVDGEALQLESAAQSALAATIANSSQWQNPSGGLSGEELALLEALADIGAVLPPDE